MKSKYTKPQIQIDELLKADVLLQSNVEATEKPDNIEQSLLNFDSWLY